MSPPSAPGGGCGTAACVRLEPRGPGALPVVMYVTRWLMLTAWSPIRS